MKCAVLACLLAVAAAAPMAEESGSATISEKEYPSAVRKALDEALLDRPKKARQLFHEDLSTSRRGHKSRRLRKKTLAGGEEDEKAAVESNAEGRGGLGQQEGWSPISLGVKSAEDSAPEARSLTTVSDASATAEDGNSTEDGSAEDTAPAASGEDAAPEDGEADPSYLSPLYAPAPGGYGGYGGYGGPYIYILPIVLPPPAGHHVPHTGRHVVTETGHESHHYSGGYQPIYAGTHGVPPIYIPKGYGGHHGVHHGGIHGGIHGGHRSGHTTVHHEDKTIIRDIDPPIFKA